MTNDTYSTQILKSVRDAVMTLVVQRVCADGYPVEHYYAAAGPVDQAERYGVDHWPGMRWHTTVDGWRVAVGEVQPMRVHLWDGTEAWQAEVLRGLRHEPDVVPVLLATAEGLGVVRVTLRRVPVGGGA